MFSQGNKIRALNSLKAGNKDGSFFVTALNNML
jgi:hypothetical protein